MMAQKSFLEVSEENHAKLVEFVERLRAAGLKLPGRLGKVNKTAVARACGFAREVFQQNSRFARTLEEAVADLGIDVPQAEEPEPRDSGDKSRIMRLEQQLAAARSENHELRRRLRRYEAIVDHVASSGRRVIP
ncbi:hypothetical protein SAMN05216566_10194 [Aureimonas phyllosphaerae]|uniref:Uncharacterized protein n=2 Tax=Aureimonas TaxID=414371 RepID=A0A1H0HD34_9HYPH|nr:MULTISPECIES: hypothetical protein [Aureimonas]SDO16970.1 hypothetical protein SAMN05192530_10437 [Aureimonas jatrophae]SFE92185.1 hypothetical protein SAMN05216566_10194 [Aureimonas phyllosphaerae]